MGDLGLGAAAAEGVGTRLAKWKGQQGAPPWSELLLALAGHHGRESWREGPPQRCLDIDPALLVLPWGLDRWSVTARGRAAV